MKSTSPDLQRLTDDDATLGTPHCAQDEGGGSHAAPKSVARSVMECDAMASLEAVELAYAAAGVGLWRRDRNTMALWPISARLHGFDMQEASRTALILTVDELLAKVMPEDAPAFEVGMRQMAQADGPFLPFRYRAITPDHPDGPRWIECRGCGNPADADGRSPAIGLHLDVTEQVANEEALRREDEMLRVSEETLDLTISALADSGYAVSDWNTDEDTFWISYQWRRFLGYEDAPNTVQFCLDLIHPDDIEDYISGRAPLLAGEVPWTEQEFRLRKADGTYTWSLLRHLTVERKPDGSAQRLVGILMDITERKEAELAMQHMADHDALTDLPNRALFRRILGEVLDGARRRPNQHAVLVCNVGRFKAINDTRGHLIGDQVLRIVANRLAQAVRPGDMVARLDGDEFAIILAAVGETAVLRACDRVAAIMDEPIRVGEFSFSLTLAIGVAILTGDEATADDMIKRADIALSIAKREEQRGTRLFEAATHASVEARSRLAVDMKQAFETRAFHLVYQPVVDVRTGRIASFEALMRWRHPVLGFVSPAAFIPVAEDTGMIETLGAWALREACREASGWPGDVRVAVNVSTVQLHPGLEAVIDAAVAEASLPLSRLKLEITESALVHDPEAALALLHRLRAKGIRIALDDFGTGYSSLGYLRRFPFDKIKIDRAFISDIADPNTAAIIRAVVGIGKRLKMGIVAEGVETAEQLALVEAEGCEEVQGFFFSRPVSGAQANAMLLESAGQPFDRHQSPFRAS